MDTKQTPESKTLSTKKITSSAWKRFLDRIRRRIAFVPSVDDTVKSLKDVGIELKDNQPWTLSPSILHRLSRFSWRIKYNQSSCNAGLQWLEAVRINNNHTSIIKVTAPPIAHSFIGNQKRLELWSHRWWRSKSSAFKRTFHHWKSRAQQQPDIN